MRINSIFEARSRKKYLRRIYHYADTSSGRGDDTEVILRMAVTLSQLLCKSNICVNVSSWLLFSVTDENSDSESELEERSKGKILQISLKVIPYIVLLFHSGTFNQILSCLVSTSPPPASGVSQVHTESSGPG